MSSVKSEPQFGNNDPITPQHEFENYSFVREIDGTTTLKVYIGRETFIVDDPSFEVASIFDLFFRHRQRFSFIGVGPFQGRFVFGAKGQIRAISSSGEQLQNFLFFKSSTGVPIFSFSNASGSIVEHVGGFSWKLALQILLAAIAHETSSVTINMQTDGGKTVTISTTEKSNL